MGAAHLRSLDTLRGAAALGVALYHARHMLGAPALIPHAYLFVDLFFVLSGFVLQLSYAGKLEAGLGLFGFMRLRWARLYPLYLALTLAGVGWIALEQLADGRFSASAMAPSVALGVLVAPVPAALNIRPEAEVFPYLAPAWSIFWEFAGSLGFALWVRAGSPRPGIVAGVALAALAAATLPRGGLDWGWASDGFWIGGLRAAAGFSLGVICARLWARRRTVAALRPSLFLGLGAGTAALAYICAAPTVWAAEFACVALAFPLVTLAAAECRSVLLSNPLGDRLGGVSYALYLCHPLAIAVTATVMAKLGFGAVGWPHGLVLAAGLAPLCWFSWTRFETPLRRRLSQPVARASRAAAPGRLRPGLTPLRPPRRG